MRIVHFSTTPLAGAPLRLVQALRTHTDHDVRLVDLAPNLRFGEDVVFSRQPDTALALATSADILHLHNYLHLASRQFAPIDFAALQCNGARVIRQFHSAPETVMEVGGLSRGEVFDGLPSLVCAQFQERYYPEARVMPQVILEDALRAFSTDAGPAGVFFAPTNQRDIFQRRWDTKAARETHDMLRRVCRETRQPLHYLTDRPLQESLAGKARAAVVVDELVTGSYHLSTLEGLCLGKPVLAWLDNRTRRVLAEVAGTGACPIVDVHLGAAAPVLRRLLCEPGEAAGVGASARAWFDAYWSSAHVAAQYAAAYRDLVESPERVRRQPALRLDDAATRYHAITLPDTVHDAARRNWWRSAPLPIRMRIGGRAVRRRVRALLEDLPVIGSWVHAALNRNTGRAS